MPWNARTLLVIDSPSHQMLRGYSVKVSLWDCLVQFHGQQPSADAGVKMRQGGLALVSPSMLWPHTCCHVGKQQTAFQNSGMSTSSFCCHKKSGKRKTAIHYVAYKNILLKVWLLLSASDLRIKIFYLFKIGSEGKILTDRSNAVGPQSILEVCICI